MTEQGCEALTIDGANQALGPLIYGFHAGLIFIAVAAVRFVIRVAIRRSTANPSGEATHEQENQVAAAAITSDNPYHPPADSA